MLIGYFKQRKHFTGIYLTEKKYNLKGMLDHL